MPGIPCGWRRWCPGAVLAQFVLAVSSRLESQDMVVSMTRTSDPRGLLRGTFAYGLVFIVRTLVFLKHCPVGVICLLLLCGGNGFAHVFGRPLGRSRLPLHAHKTWAGSVASILCGFALSLTYLAHSVPAATSALTSSALWNPLLS